jgi:hypothetical protein
MMITVGRASISDVGVDPELLYMLLNHLLVFSSTIVVSCATLTRVTGI